MADRGNEGVGGGKGQPSSSYGGAGDTAADLAARLGELARHLQDEGTVDQTLRAIVAAAVDTVPGAQFAGISVVEDRRTGRTETGTDRVVYQVDQAQYDTGEGPCLTTLFDERTVRLPDTTTETRWPRFTVRAADLGVRSMLSIQLYVEHHNLGALSLYSRDVDAFDDESEQVGLMFAAHAAVAMAGVQTEQQLLDALSVRDLIGQAKGILMERFKITGDGAFAVLVHASQNTNIKLRDVARFLVETGELAERHRRR